MTLHLRLVTGLVVLGLLCGVPERARARPTAQFLEVNAGLISGFAVDPAKPAAPVVVRLRLHVEGQVTLTRDVMADQEPLGAQGLFPAGARTGFRLLGLAAPMAARTIVELSVRDPEARAWVTTAVAVLSSATPKHAAIGLHCVAAARSGAEFTVYVGTTGTVPGEEPAAGLAIELWGQRGTWKTELAPPPSACFLAKVDLSAHPRVRELVETSRTVLVAVYAVDPDRPGGRALVGAVEVPVQDAAQGLPACVGF